MIFENNTQNYLKYAWIPCMPYCKQKKKFIKRQKQLWFLEGAILIGTGIQEIGVGTHSVETGRWVPLVRDRDFRMEFVAGEEVEPSPSKNTRCNGKLH